MNKNIESQVAPLVAEYKEKLDNGQKPTFAGAGNHQQGEYEKAVLGEAERAWTAWQNSVEGKAQMASLNTMTLDQAQQMVADLVNGPVFAPTLQMARTLPDLGLDFQSFSIGLNFEIEFILGFACTLGYAVGLQDKELESAVFLSLGLDEGVEGGAFGGVQFGLWKSQPQDLGGFALSTEMLLDVDLGVAAGVSYTATGDLLGAYLTIGAGEDVGVEEQESYTLILGHGTLGIPPIYQPNASHFLILTKLKCDNIQGDGGGNANEVYFTFQPNGGALYPYPTWDYFSMQEGDIWYCGRSVKFNSSITIKAYDSDGSSGDDLLGTCTINYSDLQVGQEKSYSIYSKSGFDEVQYYIYAKLIY